MISQEKINWLVTIDASIRDLEQTIDKLREIYGQILSQDLEAQSNECQAVADKLDISIIRKLECLTSDDTARGWLENGVKLTDIRREIANLKNIKYGTGRKSAKDQ